MESDELWVVCDMLTDKDHAEEAITQLEKWLESPTFDSPTSVRVLKDLKRAGLDEDGQVKITGVLVSHLSDLLVRGGDPELVKRIGSLLMVLAEVSARLAGSDVTEVKQPSQIDSNRLMDVLGTIAEAVVPPVVDSVQPRIQRRRSRRPEEAGGIFNGSIFGRNDEDF